MTVEEYVGNVPEERREAFDKLRDAILRNIPSGFEETINYKMIGYVVPHSVYPKGYHCDPDLPLPFINLANQKNFIAFYHMGIYANPTLLNWFVEEYQNHAKYKLDMGKSCIRFKKKNDIPFDLIAQIAQKITVQEWIDLYSSLIKK